MAFDRVLPRPTALFDEPASRLLHGHSNGFLDHKLANLSAHTRAAAMSLVAVSEMPTTRSTTNSDNCSTALAQMQLSALNREQAGQNGLLAAAFSAASTRQNTPVLATAESTAVVRDRSGSDSPTRLESVREAALQFCLCQPDPKIPRPRNAFILYRQHYQAAVVAQNPGLANPEISKIIGEQWRELPAESKEQWKALAEAEKARHQQQYPEYRYQPRRVGRDNSNRNGSNAGNPSGSTTCNRCGGRLMNPPSTPHTPLTATMPSQQNNSAKDSVSPHPGSSLSSASSTSSSASFSAGGNDPSNVNSKVAYKATETERQKNKNQWKELDSVSSEPKRRRLNNGAGTFQRGNNPVTEPYSLASQKTYVSRPGVAYFRSHVDQLATDEDFHQPQRSPALHEGEAYFDPSLTLPPLKAEGSPSAQPTTAQAQAETIMTIPVINKIRILSRVAPPLRDNSPQRGSLIAVEGQDPIQVKLMMKYLGQLLSESGRYLVRVFEGPEVARRGSICDEKKDATVDYLNVISDWHRVSDEIIQFISSKESKALSSTRTCSIASAHSPGSDATASPSPTLSQAGTAQIPIALVPRYQLTTADTFACSIPINDSYACLDHWQWIASLWRACVGPDVTVHIRECEREEIDRYGPGNPVEVRLNEARTLIIRRAVDSPKDIEEKAFKRVGFEIEDFLTW